MQAAQEPVPEQPPAPQLHFTYRQVVGNDLQQGDLLKRTPAIQALLKEVHPHYFQGQGYDYFLVLTQSCDLVLRAGECKSHYITIAAVRPLAKALERELAGIWSSPIEQRARFSSEANKEKLLMFLKRLLNNNEPEYFYLHREPEVGLSGDYCAFLRLSISVKAQLHYPALCEARILRLQESFQHKLGYLVGNMYSRVGTTDWAEEQREDDFKEFANRPLKKLVNWLSKDIHRSVLKKLEELEQREGREVRVDDLEQAVESANREKAKRKEDLLASLRRVLADTGVDQATADRIAKRFASQSEFTAFK